jgi:putative DNA-invertase from lambdoid prophage Rac
LKKGSGWKRSKVGVVLEIFGKFPSIFTKTVNTMKKIAIYTRVSTTQQTTENQQYALIRYADSLNIDYDIFTETESTRNTRPIKKALLNDLRKRKYEGVMVYKLDRWARSSRELILEINELINKGIAFISYSENLDFSTATGKLHFNILSAFAEFERELIRERTLEGLSRAKQQGKKLGRPKGSKDKKQRSKNGYYLKRKKRSSFPG